jgi:hypothetical protein
MAKRATLKGRGAKILFGEEAAPGEKKFQPHEIAGIVVGESGEREPARAPEAEAAAAKPEKDELVRVLEAEAKAASPEGPLPTERAAFVPPAPGPEEVEPTTLPPSFAPASVESEPALKPLEVKPTALPYPFAPPVPKLMEVEPDTLPPSFAPAPIEPEPPAPLPPATPGGVRAYEKPVAQEAPTPARELPISPAVSFGVPTAGVPEPTGDIDSVLKGSPMTRAPSTPVVSFDYRELAESEPEKTKLAPKTEEPTPPEEEADEAIALSRVGRKRRRELFDEIDLLYDRASVELSSNEEDANVATKYLSEARNTLIENPRQFDEAEQRVALVKAILARRGQIKRWSYTYGMFIFFWAVGWMLIFGLGLIFEKSIAQWIQVVTTGKPGPADLTMIRIFAPWGTMLMGGIGGVTGILYSLYWHVAMKQDFDRQYIMWYLVQPIMGSVLGAVVYLIFASGFLSVQVITGASASTEKAAESMSNSVILALHWTVGWAAGFRQRFVYELIDRIVQLLTPKPEELAKEGKEEPTSLRPSAPPTPAPSEVVAPSSTTVPAKAAAPQPTPVPGGAMTSAEAAALAAEAAAAAPGGSPAG